MDYASSIDLPDLSKSWTSRHLKLGASQPIAIDFDFVDLAHITSESS